MTARLVTWEMWGYREWPVKTEVSVEVMKQEFYVIFGYSDS